MAHGAVAKLLLGLLVLSFAVWGIGDIFRGTGGDTIATVEDETITESELNHLINLLQRNYQQITPESVGDPFFKLQVLNTLINDRLLEIEAADMNLYFSDDILARVTSRNPMFQKPDGTFDKDLFTLTLQQNNHTERTYLAKLREEMTRSLLHDTLQLGVSVPEEMVALYQNVRDEEREADLIMLDADDVEAPKTPNDSELQIFYESQSSQYMNPEFRTIAYVSFSSDDVWKQLDLAPNDDILKSMYAERKEAFTLPEKRKVRQLLFMELSEAQEAHEKLKKGTIFNQVAKSEAVLNKDDNSLGYITPDELPANASEIVFTLDKGAFSEPIESSFGWHIFLVQDITPQKQQSFASVKKRLAADYKAEMIDTEVTQLGYRIEDALAAGMTLSEALKENGLGGLKIASLGPISYDATTPKGAAKKITKLQEDVLAAGFSLEEGDTAPLAVSQSNDYFIVQLESVIPAQAKPIESIKDTLIKAYKQQHTNLRLRQLADETAVMLQSAENKNAAIRDAGLKTVKSGRIKRHHETVKNSGALKNKILTSGFTLDLFELQPGESTGAYPLPSGEYVIGILSNVHKAKEAKEKRIVALHEELTNAVPDEILQLFLAHLRTKYDVSIREDRLFGSVE